MKQMIEMSQAKKIATTYVALQSLCISIRI